MESRREWTKSKRGCHLRVLTMGPGTSESVTRECSQWAQAQAQVYRKNDPSISMYCYWIAYRIAPDSFRSLRAPENVWLVC